MTDRVRVDRDHHVPGFQQRFHGTVGGLERVDEQRVEVVLPRRSRSVVVRGLLNAHPCEVPACHVETATFDEP